MPTWNRYGHHGCESVCNCDWLQIISSLSFYSNSHFFFINFSSQIKWLLSSFCTLLNNSGLVWVLMRNIQYHLCWYKLCFFLSNRLFMRADFSCYYELIDTSLWWSDMTDFSCLSSRQVIFIYLLCLFLLLSCSLLIFHTCWDISLERSPFCIQLCGLHETRVITHNIYCHFIKSINITKLMTVGYM